MNHEAFNPQSPESVTSPARLTRRGKLAVTVLGAVMASGAVLGVNHLANAADSDIHGKQTVRVSPGDTVDGLVKEFVDGGASHVGEVRTYVVHNPENADVFENDQLDPGEKIELPTSVE